jgi:formamidopyrimidine-DNA glycosylase
MGGLCHQRRSFARQSRITMMPEGPEVRTLVDQLQGGVGRRLVDIQFLSGRYVRHGKPESFEAFARTMVPTFQPHSNVPQVIDIIQEWNAKGKFIYITLDDGNNKPAGDDDYQRSIWVTLGMSGRFVTEQVHEQNPRFARWYIELLDVDSMDSRKVYYHDQRNFGTLKFCLSKQELVKKLDSLGLDILDPRTTQEDFLAVVDKQKPELNVCKFLMDQSVRSRSLKAPYYTARTLFRAGKSLISLCFSFVAETIWCRKLHTRRMFV